MTYAEMFQSREDAAAPKPQLPHESGVSRAIQSIAETNADTAKRIAHLTTLLAPILSPEVNEKQTSAPPSSPTECGLHDTLAGLLRQAADNFLAVSALADRIRL